MAERSCPQCGQITQALVCPADGTPTQLPGIGTDSLTLGSTVAARFRVEKLLGRGGFGAVYQATHLVTGQELVLKVMRANVADDPTQVQRFNQEAKVMARIKHPNTVQLIDFGQTETGLLYLAMELLTGRELGVLLKENRILPPVRAVQIALGVLKSLGAAHAAGLVHRDLKPDNIFLCQYEGEDDHVKVIDFGIAKPIDAQADQGLTRTGFTVGTPKYMSPEQVLNQPLDGRSDLYALGVILYQCLAGEVPLQGASSVETLMAHLQKTPEPLSTVADQPLLPGLEAVVMQALRKDPAERYEDAEDMRAALEDVLAAGGPLAVATNRRAMSAKLRKVAQADLDDGTTPHPSPTPQLRTTSPQGTVGAAAVDRASAGQAGGSAAGLAAAAPRQMLDPTKERLARAAALPGAGAGGGTNNSAEKRGGAHLDKPLNVQDNYAPTAVFATQSQPVAAPVAGAPAAAAAKPASGGRRVGLAAAVAVVFCLGVGAVWMGVSSTKSRSLPDGHQGEFAAPNTAPTAPAPVQPIAAALVPAAAAQVPAAAAQVPGAVPAPQPQAPPARALQAAAAMVEPSQLAKATDVLQPALASCLQGAAWAGPLFVTVTVQATGAVSDVQLPESLKTLPAAACVTMALRAYAFAADPASQRTGFLSFPLANIAPNAAVRAHPANRGKAEGHRPLANGDEAL